MVKRLAVLMLCGAAFAQLPDAPKPQPPKTWEEYSGHSARFVTFRGSWEAPPLRSNKQVLKAPTFWIGQAAVWTSMIVACRNPRSGEQWHSEVPAMAGVAAFSYIGERYFSSFYAAGIEGYATTHYIISASR